MAAMNSEIRQQIFRLYTSPATGYTPPRKFWRYLLSIGIKVTYKELLALLRELVPSLTIGKPHRARFPRRVYLPKTLDSLFVADTFFFSAQVMRSNRRAGWLPIYGTYRKTSNKPPSRSAPSDLSSTRLAIGEGLLEVLRLVLCKR